MSQEELAGRVDLARTSITNIERGTQPVSLGLLYGLSDALGCEPAQLLPDRDPPDDALGDAHLSGFAPREQQFIRSVVAHAERKEEEET